MTYTLSTREITPGVWELTTTAVDSHGVADTTVTTLRAHNAVDVVSRFVDAAQGRPNYPLHTGFYL